MLLSLEPEARPASLARPLQDRPGLAALLQRQAVLPRATLLREASQQVVPQLISLRRVPQGWQEPAGSLQLARQEQPEPLDSQAWKE